MTTKIRGILMPFFSLLLVMGMAAGIAAQEVYTAVPSADNTTLNGSPVTMQAYKINGSNYVKLRDFAQMVNGTPLNFEVTWDGGLNAINMYTPQAYTPVGGEGASTGTEEKQATDTTSTIYVNGSVVSLKGYNINNNNYFKLRDLGTALGIWIDWDNAARTVVVDSTGNVDPAQAKPSEPPVISGLNPDGTAQGTFVSVGGEAVIAGNHIDEWKPGMSFTAAGIGGYTAEESAADFEGIIIGGSN